jgi:hypothetical protein
MVLIATIAAGRLAAAQWDAPAAAARIAPLVDELTIAVAHVDLAAWSPKESFSLARRLTDDRQWLVAEEGLAAPLVDGLKSAGAREAFIVVSLADFPLREPFAAIPLDNANDAQALAAVVTGRPGVATQRFDKLLVIGAPQVVERLKSLRPAVRKDLAPALAAAGEHSIRIAIVPPAHFWRTVQEAAPRLPDEIGGGALAPAAAAFRFAGIGLSPKAEPSLRIELAARDAASAMELGTFLKQLIANLRAVKPVQNAIETDQLAELKVQGDRLVWSFAAPDEALKLLRRPIRRLRAAGAEDEVRGSLHQIGIALHSYVAKDTQGQFPPAYVASADGRPLLSWRVLLLPHLGHGELYKKFRLDEPWDSPHNRPLVSQMPSVYAHPFSTVSREGKTVFLTPRAPHTVFPGAEQVKIRDIKDGTSSTLIVVEVADERAVFWTKPDDWQLDEKNLAAGLGGHFADVFLALAADASAHVLKIDQPAEKLRAHLTRAGRESPLFDRF